VTSLFTRKSQPGTATFRLRWRGYDREQVDTFLRQTAADRQRLEESLAQLETFMASHGDERRREFERLAKLRVDVASCLETSIGALRTATQLLGKDSAVFAQAPADGAATSARSTDHPARALRVPVLRFQLRRPEWLAGRRGQALAASAFLTAAVPVTFYYRSSAHEITADAPRAAVFASKAVVEDKPLPKAVEPQAAGVPQQAEGLVLTLTAKRECWIRTRIDGGQPLERTLKAEETIMLRANEEAFLRVGDASALSLLINNRLAKPLGASGAVVATTITRNNYQSMLVAETGP
jgi:DivIVA domain-containing protein